MSADELTGEGQVQRDRRARRVSAALVLGVAVAVLVISRFRRGEVPASVRGPLFLGLTAVIIGGSLYYERADEWQRRRALQAFALAGLGGIIWLLAATAGVDRAATPGSALAAITVTWLTADLLLRLWPSVRSTSDREVQVEGAAGPPFASKDKPRGGAVRHPVDEEEEEQ